MAANTLLKIVFVVVQSFLILLGLGLIITGSWAEEQNNDYRRLVSLNELQYGPYLCIAAGCALIVVSAIGLVGACCETKINKFLLSFYIILVAVILLAQLSSGILSLVYRSLASDMIRNELNTTFFEYGTVNTTKDNWDYIQQEFRCCGIDSVEEWVTNRTFFSGAYFTYPKSCCSRNMSDASGCGRFEGITTNNFFQRGCNEALADFTEQYLLTTGIVAITFIIGEIMIIATAIVLLCFSEFDE